MTASNLVLSGDAEHQDFPVYLPIHALSQMMALKSYESTGVPTFLHRNFSSVHMVAPCKGK